MKYLLNLTYDGSKFYGFQKQSNYMTVQGELEKVISKIMNKEIKVIGASRTDRGVHAYNQYVHFETDRIIDSSKFINSVNKLLNKSIYIKNITTVKDDFSARYDVKMKEYVYKINVGQYNPMDNDYILQYCKSIDLRLLKHALRKIKGTHNFKSFTSDKSLENYERTIKSIKIYQIANYVFIVIKAKSFLRYMIRNIVGLLLEINEGKREIKDIEYIFNSLDRSKNAASAEANGLYLNEIWY